jgi:hypothetical protein
VSQKLAATLPEIPQNGMKQVKLIDGESWLTNSIELQFGFTHREN